MKPFLIGVCFDSSTMEFVTSAYKSRFISTLIPSACIIGHFNHRHGHAGTGDGVKRRKQGDTDRGSALS
jgi:hypothetical protein